MKFAPRTKDEIDAMSLLKPGIYHFSVANAEDAVSKSGNEMIKITLDVYDELGNTRQITDFLLEAMASKLFSFCQATNMTRYYQEGALKASDCLQASAYVEIGIQKGRDKPEGGTYSDRNEAKRYLSKEEAQQKMRPTDNKLPATSQEPTPGLIDDDIPF